MPLFPEGVGSYLIGGALIGSAVGLVFLSTGIVAGASGFFSSSLSWISRRAGFRSPELLASRSWRAAFAVGLVCGALLFTLALRSGETWQTSVQPWRLLLGGVLVGFGTRLSRGCTSGHGVCGLASASLPSLCAVVTFMAVAIATAFAVRAAGVVP